MRNILEATGKMHDNSNSIDKIKFLFLLLLLVGCSSVELEERMQNSCKNRIADRVLRKATSEINQKTSLRPIGTAGQMMHEIEMLGLAFNCYEDLTIEEGRNLLLFCVDALMKTVNENEEIRHYLKNYPFNEKNIEIRLFLQHPDGSKTQPGELTVLVALKGKIEYEIRDPITKRLKIIYEETYEEAKSQIANKQIIVMAKKLI